MVDCKTFCAALGESGVDFFAGVPDSLLKSFCAFIADTLPSERRVTAANEGGAVALAAGHYLATSRPALVYMQNSGEGNAVNPLASLADPDVYGIPMILLIGWRGEPGVHDEPQHVKQGKITTSLLEVLGIPWRVLPEETAEAVAAVRELTARAAKESRPVALVVQKGAFAPYTMQKAVETGPLPREEVIATLTACLPEDAVVVSTTGHISRELYECRERTNQGHARDFLTVGSMGHASQIALAIALAKPERPVVCLDGDGAALMHLGGWAIAGQSGARNLLHLVLNNGAHGSVGGQPTVGLSVRLTQVAEACGYRSARRLEDLDSVRRALEACDFRQGPVLFEIPVGVAARKELGRPTTTPQQNKEALMRFLGSR